MIWTKINKKLPQNIFNLNKAWEKKRKEQCKRKTKTKIEETQELKCSTQIQLQVQ